MILDTTISSLREGDSVVISDCDTILKAIEMGMNNVITGVPLQIVEVERLFSDNISFYKFKLTNGQYLCAFSVDKHVDWYIMVKPEWFQHGPRSEQLVAENFFLFKQPADPDNFTLGDLELADSFSLMVGDEEVPYSLVLPTIYGENDAENMMSFTQYANGDRHVIINELGTDNSWVEFIEGYSIDSANIELYIV